MTDYVSGKVNYLGTVPRNAHTQKFEQIQLKSSDFSNNFSSTDKADNNKSNSAEAQLSVPPPLPDNPPPQLLNHEFISRDSDILGVITQRQWTIRKNPSSLDNVNKSKSVMSTKVETTVRQWSTPIEKVVEGQPPRPVSH